MYFIILTFAQDITFIHVTYFITLYYLLYENRIFNYYYYFIKRDKHLYAAAVAIESEYIFEENFCI